MQGHQVAAEETTGVRGSQARTPEYPTHALVGQGTTACGLDASAMHRFEGLVYEELAPILHCPRCAAALRPEPCEAAGAG